jgi:hypothetical protein
MECALEIMLLFTKVSSYYHQLALSQATGDKGPTGPGGFPPDPFQYLQAQVGPVGPRGPPGMQTFENILRGRLKVKQYRAYDHFSPNQQN